VTAPSCAAQMHAGERLRMPLVEDRAAWLEQLCAGGGGEVAAPGDAGRRAGEVAAPGDAGRRAGEVAHLGCADSPYTEELLRAGVLLHTRLVRVATVTGIDVDEHGLELLRRALPGERLVLADITAGVPAPERGRYELVLAGEVLEHVADADAFLRGCGELLAPGGRLCVTVPNACCPKIGLRALAGRESVHPDHRVYYGPRTLERTLNGAGLDVESLASCFAPAAGRAGRTIFNPLLRASHRAFQGPVGDGLIALARARSNAASIAS
jgi:2-polyprenyl-3-methyl-5-hydroxy-6-metoxy-1,4-benzoquinol methylase